MNFYNSSMDNIGMNIDINGLLPEELTQVCKDYEHYVTPQWAIDAIIREEKLWGRVIDPCTGTGVLAEAAKKNGAESVHAYDIIDWGYPLTAKENWLDDERWPTYVNDATCFMNPPFSVATQFVEKAIQRGFQKIICFQRFAWYESKERREFWNANPPQRVWICGERAKCWRHDLPTNERGKRCDPTTRKELGGSSTAHAWFVWSVFDRCDDTRLLRLYR